MTPSTASSPLRFYSGVLGAILMIGTGLLHSLLGWGEMVAAFERTRAPDKLVHGLAVPWHFAGLAMITFGVISIANLLEVRRGSTGSAMPARIVGIMYVVFSVIGAVMIDLDPTFVVFLVPGLLVLFGSLRRAS